MKKMHGDDYDVYYKLADLETAALRKYSQLVDQQGEV